MEAPQECGSPWLLIWSRAYGNEDMSMLGLTTVVVVDSKEDNYRQLCVDNTYHFYGLYVFSCYL